MQIKELQRRDILEMPYHTHYHWLGVGLMGEFPNIIEICVICSPLHTGQQRFYFTINAVLKNENKMEPFAQAYLNRQVFLHKQYQGLCAFDFFIYNQWRVIQVEKEGFNGRWHLMSLCGQDTIWFGGI